MIDFDELYRAHRHLMFRLACSYVKDEALAEDVVQAVFERLLTDEIRDPEAALSYLTTATVRRSLTAIRDRAVRVRRDDQVGRRDHTDAPSAEHVALQKIHLADVLDAVPNALRALRSRQRTVLTLRYYHDMNEEQISDALGISRGAVKSHAARGKAHLARTLDRMPRRPESPPPCPNEADHTPGQPAGYLAWHAWAEEMSKTHKQRRCKGCGLLQIWVPKNTTAATREDTDHDTR